MFEGGKETYANWIDLSVGGLFTDGNNAQAQQRTQYKEGAFGGIEDFHYSAKAGKKYIASECPLAGVHILQGMERLDGDGVTVPERAPHPIELMARAYGF